MLPRVADTEEGRRQRYGQFVKEMTPDGQWALMREAMQRGQLTGTERFVDEVERIIGRRVERRGQGRPSKEARSEKKSVPFFLAVGKERGCGRLHMDWWRQRAGQ